MELNLSKKDAAFRNPAPGVIAESYPAEMLTANVA